ncbi:MAG: rod shape-determining protein MreC [Patescibacteria group bacterium]
MKKELITSFVALLLFVVIASFGSPFFLRARSFLSYGTIASNTFIEEESGKDNGQSSRDALRAEVYSRYPFNFKNELLISRGFGQGVSVGQAVVYKEAFVGVVKEVFENSALVETLFDPTFKLPVRVGALGVDALLVGGVNPEITLIPENASISQKDIVRSTGDMVPFGTVIGLVGEISSAKGETFRKSSLVVLHPLYEIREVVLLPLVKKK